MQCPGEVNSLTLYKVQGRVDITRTFDGDELNREYIFGLFSDPVRISLVGVPVTYNITHFVANDNIASASTIVTYNSTTFGILIPVTIDTWIKFNPEGKISQYDVTFKWFTWLLDFLLETIGKKINAEPPEQVLEYVSDLLAKSVCATHERHCNGSNQQFENTTSCYDFMTKSIPFGKGYQLGGNTLLCRDVHEHMVQYRPDVHCAHLGPSGGGYCVDDRSYGRTILQEYFDDSWVPYGYG